MLNFPKKEIFDGLYMHFLGTKISIFPFLDSKISFLDIKFLKKEI